MDATTLIMRVYVVLFALLVLYIGFVFGFGAVLAFFAGAVALCWLYWRIVPRQALAYDYQFLYR